MNNIRSELKELGRKIANDAKRNALPNKRTGTLDRSIEYDYSYINGNKFSVIIREVYYGKYLNDKTSYLDRAISKNLDRGIEDIIDVQINELLKDI